MADGVADAPKKGKRHPPESGKIKKNEIRNPKGRGKGVPNIDKVVVKIATEVAGYVDNKPVLRIENLMRKTFKRAEEGDARAREEILKRFERATQSRNDADALSQEDQRIYDELMRLSRPRKGEADAGKA